MASVVSLPEQKVILENISWETYERLLAENQENSGTHFIYDNGRLEIMVVSYEHEILKDIIALLVNTIAEELVIDITGAGSTTFQREELAKGFEPDACFYIKNADRVCGKKQLDLSVDPAPDLIIEVDITSPSLNRFPIFAAFGVTEVWHYRNGQVIFYRLETDDYVETKESLAFSKVTSDVVTKFVELSQQVKRTAWLRQVREWVRAIEGQGINASV
jgi:Uma2 family endonuclease